MWTKAFWQAAVERALKTLIQVLGAFAAFHLATWTGALLQGSAPTVAEIIDLPWSGVLLVAGIAALLSVATSLLSALSGNKTPSFRDLEVIPGEVKSQIEEVKSVVEKNVAEVQEQIAEQNVVMEEQHAEVTEKIDETLKSPPTKPQEN